MTVATLMLQITLAYFSLVIVTPSSFPLLRAVTLARRAAHIQRVGCGLAHEPALSHHVDVLCLHVRGNIQGRWCLTSDRAATSTADDPQLAGSGGCPRRAVVVVPCEGGDIHGSARCQKTAGELVDAGVRPPSYGRRGPMAELQ
jgi:hypothetical protein